MNLVSAEAAVALIEPGHRVYVHEAAMAPTELLVALADRCRSFPPHVPPVEVVHLHIEGPAPHLAPDLAGKLRHRALFVGANARQAVAEGRADFTPVFLSDIPALFRDGTLPIDVALISVSPPDRHGLCRLGTSVAAARAAVDHARRVIALVNRRVPVTSGHTAVPVSRFDAMVEIDRPLHAHSAPPPGSLERIIGTDIASRVADGSTLQLGIGSIPDAVLDALHGRSDLGVHTEMFSDGLVRLAATGALTGAKKERFVGRIVSSFAVGAASLYDFCDGNALVEFHSADVVNDTREIRKQTRMVSINSAIEIDLTGQVCADSMGHHIWSGIGGQLDFVRGALLSPGGQSFIALPATAARGTLSRIVPELKPGAGVVTTRGHVQWIVTEYGAVNLRGKSLRERAELLTSIAHPDFRGELRDASARRIVG